MALLAIGAQSCFVHIGMAQDTIVEVLSFVILEHLCRTHISIQLMTFPAVYLLVFAAQRKTRLRMIEFAVVNRGERFLIVTIIAFVAKRTFMRIRVARCTARKRHAAKSLKQGTVFKAHHVATFTIHLLVFSFEWKISFAVIK